MNAKLSLAHSDRIMLNSLHGLKPPLRILTIKRRDLKINEKNDNETDS